MTDIKIRNFSLRLFQTAKLSIERIGNKINSEPRFSDDSSEKQGSSYFDLNIGTAYAEKWCNAKAVFYLSTGRVGTETLTSLLNLSSGIQAVHEPSPRLIHSSYQAFMQGINKSNIDMWKEVILAARDDYILQANQNGKTYVETNNRLTYLSEALSVAFPASKFIFVHRHPYDVIRSGMRRGYYSWHPGDFARYHPRSNDPYYGEWNSFSPLEKTAWYWNRVNSDSRRFIEALPASRAFELRSDELFSGKEDALQGLYTFINAAYPSTDKIEEVLGKRLNQQKEGNFPPPDDWSREELIRVKNIVSDTASQLGYYL